MGLTLFEDSSTGVLLIFLTLAAGIGFMLIILVCKELFEILFYPDKRNERFKAERELRDEQRKEARRKRREEEEAEARRIHNKRISYSRSSQNEVVPTKPKPKGECSYCDSGTNYVCRVPNGCKNGVCKRCRESGRAKEHFKSVVIKKRWHGQWADVRSVRDGYMCKKCAIIASRKWSDDGSDVGY